jgi:threonine/homoserine/homoserine lactone efflux protein
MTAAPGHGGGVRDFGRGLLNNLLNPKIGAFYIAFLPQFIAPGQPVFLMSVALASMHAALGIMRLLFYAAFLTTAGDLVRRPQARRTMERVTGIALVGLGVRLTTGQ